MSYQSSQGYVFHFFTINIEIEYNVKFSMYIIIYCTINRNKDLSNVEQSQILGQYFGHRFEFHILQMLRRTDNGIKQKCSSAAYFKYYKCTVQYTHNHKIF
jgi:hypothetical protein